jgi:hypothetical protein
LWRARLRDLSDVEFGCGDCRGCEAVAVSAVAVFAVAVAVAAILICFAALPVKS